MESHIQSEPEAVAIDCSLDFLFTDSDRDDTHQL